MKKVLLLIMAMLFCLTGCGEKEDDSWKKVNYSCETLRIECSNTFSFELTQDEKSYILEFMNNGNWEYDCIKTAGNHTLHFDGTCHVYYIADSSFGAMLNDVQNTRHLILSEEENAYIQGIIERNTNPIIVGMDETQIKAIKDFEYLSYNGYLLYKRKDNCYNIVAEFDENGKIATITKHNILPVISANFEKIEVGMDVHDVVKTVGIPYGHSDNETIALNYVTYEKDEFRVVFDNEMKVTEVIKVE